MPMRCAPLVILATLACLLGGCATKPEVEPEPKNSNAEAQAALEQGLAARTAGNDKAALAELERAIAINPKLSAAYMAIGDIHLEWGQYAEAEKGFSVAAELEPGNFDAQYRSGLCLQMLKQFTEAVRAYLKALAIRPDDFDANLNLATAYLQMNEPAQAVPYAQRAVRAKPDSGPARVNLGAAYAAAGNNAAAVVEYQQAAELMPLTPALLLNLADSLAKSGRLPEAEQTVRELLKSNPTAEGYERLGSALFRLKRYDDALAAFRKSLESDPDYYPALNGVGVCLLNRYLWSDRKDNEARQEALTMLRRSVRIDPSQTRIVELLSRFQ